MSTLAPPTQSPQSPQHLQALEQANRTRLARAALRAEIRSLPVAQGRAMVAEVIRFPPACAETWPIYDALCALRGVGRCRALAILGEVGVPERKQLRDLTPRQRERLGSSLREGGL